MKNVKHTPGPWVYKPDTRTSYNPQTGAPIIRTLHWIQNNGSDCIALVSNREALDISAAQTEADARLFALAPELLDALAQLVKLHNIEHRAKELHEARAEAWRVAEALVAKIAGVE